jgi:hypothetical protein
MPARRFPPPWSAEELDACFVVRDPPSVPGGSMVLEFFQRHCA